MEQTTCSGGNSFRLFQLFQIVPRPVWNKVVVVSDVLEISYGDRGNLFHCSSGLEGNMIDLERLFKPKTIPRGGDDKAPSGHAANTPDGINREAGLKLLYALWDAGYSLRLVPSTRPIGWTLVPIGEATPSGDLLKLFDENHDAAVALLLEACRTAQCRPEDWPPLHLLYAATKYNGDCVSEL